MKKLHTIVMSGALAATMCASAIAAEMPPKNVVIASRPDTPVISPAPQSMPDSILYYGKISELVTNDAGELIQLRMESDYKGAYTMNVSPNTLWIDSTLQAAAPASDVQVGESLYVFHSPIATFSLPPQSFAFAVVRKIPADASCPMYHEVEDVAGQDGSLSIVTDNGELTVLTGKDTTFTLYDGSEASAADVKDYGTMVVWYADTVNKETHTVPASHILLGLKKAVPETPPAEEVDATPLTRGALAAALYEKAGSPAVDFLMDFADVDPSNDAIRWAASEKLMEGYGDGSFGPQDLLTREQLVTVLWRSARSPMLMDYTGLTTYTDASAISSYAGYALSWAHQQGLLAHRGETLEPQGQVTAAEANAMLETIRTGK